MTKALSYYRYYIEEPTNHSNSSESDWDDYHHYADRMDFLTYTEWINFFQLHEKMYRNGSENIEGLIELYQTARDKVITSDLPEKVQLLGKIETEIKRTLSIRKSKIEAAPKVIYWKGDERYSQQVGELSEIAVFTSAILRDYLAGELTINELRGYYQVGKAILDDRKNASGDFYHMAKKNLEQIQKIIAS